MQFARRGHRQGGSLRPGMEQLWTRKVLAGPRGWGVIDRATNNKFGPRVNRMRFEPHDPTWLVELAKTERPDLPWLVESLARCVQCHWKRRRIYVYFVDPEPANQPGADWQYRETISLEHPKFGHIKLDILKDNRVGGVEFYDRLFSSGRPKKT
jgi:hypothetical protein